MCDVGVLGGDGVEMCQWNDGESFEGYCFVIWIVGFGQICFFF